MIELMKRAFESRALLFILQLHRGLEEDGKVDTSLCYVFRWRGEVLEAILI